MTKTEAFEKWLEDVRLESSVEAARATFDDGYDAGYAAARREAENEKRWTDFPDTMGA